ncbi:MAG TPA: tRNA epoxyqueuosine(34) reductase QueG, partial [Chthonomonadales bacterium]|nr:tRNA epoxyqueuosine(34) reductase QueG [Chthonomonadales bacterium]
KPAACSAADRQQMAENSSRNLEAAIKEQAEALGFDMVGISSVEPSIFKQEYQDWIERGFAGEMRYMERDPERRLDPSLLLPGAKSIVVCAAFYYSDEDEGPGTPRNRDPERAIFARYARGDDYHDVLGNRLKELLQFIKREAGPDTEGRAYVDTGPILEREVARRAGLGWFGKNTMLINTRRGSYFLLGEIILNLALQPDRPAIGGCGSCTACLDACPTGAIVAPFQLDARRCISYLTIELKGDLPPELAPAIYQSGNRVFGCDICQEVCPFNLRRSVPVALPEFQPRKVASNPLLSDLLEMDEETFRESFRKSAVRRAKRNGLQRSAASARSWAAAEK